MSSFELCFELTSQVMDLAEMSSAVGVSNYEDSYSKGDRSAGRLCEYSRLRLPFRTDEFRKAGELFERVVLRDENAARMLKCADPRMQKILRAVAFQDQPEGTFQVSSAVLSRLSEFGCPLEVVTYMTD